MDGEGDVVAIAYSLEVCPSAIRISLCGSADVHGLARLIIVPVNTLQAAGNSTQEFIRTQIIQQRHSALGILAVYIDGIGRKHAITAGRVLGQQREVEGHALDFIEVAIITEDLGHGSIQILAGIPRVVRNQHITHGQLRLILFQGQSEQFRIQNAHAPCFVIETQRAIVVAVRVAIRIDVHKTSYPISKGIQIIGAAHRVGQQRAPVSTPAVPARQRIDGVLASLFTGIRLHLRQRIQEQILVEAVLIRDGRSADRLIQVPTDVIAERATLGRQRNIAQIGSVRRQEVEMLAIAIQILSHGNGVITMHLLDICAILVNVGSHIQQQTRIDQFRSCIGSFHAEHIRQIAACSHYCKLVPIETDKLNADARGLIDQVKRDIVFFAIGHILSAYANGHGNGFLAQAVVIPSRGVALERSGALGQRGSAAQHHAQRQNDGQDFFHGFSSFYLCRANALA